MSKDMTRYDMQQVTLGDIAPTKDDEIDEVTQDILNMGRIDWEKFSTIKGVLEVQVESNTDGKIEYDDIVDVTMTIIDPMDSSVIKSKTMPLRKADVWFGNWIGDTKVHFWNPPSTISYDVNGLFVYYYFTHPIRFNTGHIKDVTIVESL